MNKHLIALAENLGWKQGSDCIWGQHNKAYFQIIEVQGKAPHFEIYAHAKRQDLTVTEKIISHPQLTPYKLKPSALSWQSDHNAVIHRLGLTIPGVAKKLEEIVPAYLEAFTQSISANDVDVTSLCESSHQGQHCTNKHDRPLVINGLLQFLCSSCFNHLQQSFVEAQRAWDKIQPNYMFGTLAALFGALAGAAAWLAVVIFGERDFLLLAVVSGIACGFCYKWGAKKVNLAGKVIVFVMTLLGFFTVNYAYLLYLLYDGGASFSNEAGETVVLEGKQLLIAALMAYVDDLMSNVSNTISTYAFPLIGAFYAAYLTTTTSPELKVED